MTTGKESIGEVINIQREPAYYEFFNAHAGIIRGHTAKILYNEVHPDTPISKSKLRLISIFPEIKTFRHNENPYPVNPQLLDEVFFLNDLGDRCFFIDEDKNIKEFLPDSRTAVSPTDYDNIQIIDSRDVPLMFLPDKSLLVARRATGMYYPNLVSLTLTTETPFNLSVDGEEFINTFIYNFNFVGDKASLNAMYGNIEFTDALTANIVVNDTRPHEGSAYTASKLTTMQGGEVIAANCFRFTVDEEFPNPPRDSYVTYNNEPGKTNITYATADSASLIQYQDTQEFPPPTVTNGYGRGAIFAVPEKAETLKLAGLIEDIRITPERREYVPKVEKDYLTESEQAIDRYKFGLYRTVWIPATKTIILSVQVTTEEIREVLQNPIGLKTFKINGVYYMIDSVESIGRRVLIVVLLYTQSVFDLNN